MIVETGIADEAGIAKEIADGELWDVRVKSHDQQTKEVDCAQTGIEDFICVQRGDQSSSFAREQEVRETSEKKEGVATCCKPALVRKNRMG